MDITQSPQTRFMSRNFDYLFDSDTFIDTREIQRIFKVFLIMDKLAITSTRQILQEFDTKFEIVFVKIWGRGVDRNWGDGV
jgi:hypothetical protein